MSIAAATAQGQTLSPILTAACLDDLAHALSDRPGVPEDQRLDHASAAKRLILAFQPQDAMQLMLAGQTVLFNALTADSARNILRGMAEPMTSRARSNVTAMGRLVSKHVDTLIELQGHLNRTGTLADTQEQIPTSPAEPPPRHPAPDHEPPNPDEPNETPVAEAPAEPVSAEPASAEPAPAQPAPAEPAPAEPAPAEPAPAPAARLYPGRETMLAARPSRISRRKKTQLAHKLMNVLRAAQIP